MPPANTQQSHSNSRLSTEPGQQDTAAHSAYLSAIRQIEAIPVPDLAATLTNPAEDEANEANISFLRTPIDPQDEWRAQNAERESFEEHRQRMQSMSRAADYLQLSRDDRARRERLQRVLAGLNRLHDPAYSDRIPSHNSLYDWSPAGEGEANEETDLRSIRRELLHQQQIVLPEALRAHTQTQLDAERERSSRAHSSRFLSSSSSSQNETSLRSAAILQAVRRHPRFAARSRDHMQRHIMDRSDRPTATDDEAVTRATPESRRAAHAQQRPSEGSGSYHSESRPRMRRAILQDPSSNSSSSSDWLHQTITYLANLRSSNCYEDSLGHAVDAGFVTKEFFGDRHDDFILDVQTLAPTYPTSLLVPGAVFEGHQRAHADIATSYNPPPRRWEQDWRWESNNSSRHDYLPRLTLDDHSRHWSSTVPPHAQRAPHISNHKYWTPDFWPVTVRIHAVDYDRMTMAATMEAYDVPSHPPPPPTNSELLSNAPLVIDNSRNAAGLLNSDTNRPIPTGHSTSAKEKKKSITTYLEGEILDFRNFTFLTESFPSCPENDATYWRKLEPFKDFSDDELVRRLVSKSYLEQLSKSYILMRWKERCFVRDSKESGKSSSNASTTATTHRVHVYSGAGAGSGTTDSAHDWYDSVEMADGCGLTISGFYYVCMRRADGAVEGLYCDPQSSPYQHLKLERKGDGGLGRFPVWEFK